MNILFPSFATVTGKHNKITQTQTQAITNKKQNTDAPSKDHSARNNKCQGNNGQRQHS